MEAQQIRPSLAARLGWPTTSAAGRREATWFYVFASPYLVGLLVLGVGPILVSLYLGFTNYDAATTPRWIGLYNYQHLFTDDPAFRQSLKVTLLFTAMNVPLAIVVPLAVAILLNQKIKAMALFRTIFYLPSVMSGVAVAMLWVWLLNPRFGVVNWLLGFVGIQGPGWLTSETWALPSLVLMSAWGLGGAMVINLAALQGVPLELVEQATVDGANALVRFRHVTIPMISPVILFDVIMSVIGSLQTFTAAFIMTGGGPNGATYFYNLYLYENAFRAWQMGRASAQAWVLFVIIMICTALLLRFSSSRVFYSD